MPSVYEIADDKMDKIEIIMSKYFSFVRTGDPELREAARARIDEVSDFLEKVGVLSDRGGNSDKEVDEVIRQHKYLLPQVYENQ